jgi:hypothetical protein
MKASAIAVAALCSLVTMNSACVRSRVSPRAAETPRASMPHPEFVDVPPGSKLQVVIPILRSGGFIVPSVRRPGTNNTLSIETGGDFLGYERAHYRAMPREGGVRIRYVRSEVWEKGKTSTRRSPRLDLFSEAASARYVRLIYLVRLSLADHNMAIIASNDPATLVALSDRRECANGERGSTPDRRSPRFAPSLSRRLQAE